ncbi:TPA: GNAT family N-acetyltransferase [Shewanella algae]|nr:GNAT family N-acetyltransferase [Shewanella algae]
MNANCCASQSATRPYSHLPQPKPEQRDLLADNMLSIAEAQFFPFYVPKAIYLDDTPVGFLMYESLAEEGKPNDYNIFRFMVAEGYQQKGIGSRAMALVLEEIRAQENAQRVHICYADENQTARAFYAGFGFVEQGPDPEDEDEIIATLELQARA